MSRETLHSAISKMFAKLNDLIEKSNYDLLDNEVQNYSRKLDKMIIWYNKAKSREMAG